MGKPLNIGRVILPTLKIIYDRDREVESFVSNDYFKLQATFKTEKNEEYDGFYTVEGWKKIEKIESKDVMLPFVSINEPVQIVDSKVTSHKTTPPKQHTEKILLRVMETCGKKFEGEDSNEMMAAILSGFSIGTPATRAETIKKLKDIGYIYGRDKFLTCTELGRKIVERFHIKDLLDLEYTGKLEKTLSDIEKEKFKKDDFLKFVFDFVTEAVNKIKTDAPIILKDNSKKTKDYSSKAGEGDSETEKPAKSTRKTSPGKSSRTSKKAEDSNTSGNEAVSPENQSVSGRTSKSTEKQGPETFGKCPACGHDIIEGQRGFGCSNWRSGCKFVIWKEDEVFKAFRKKLTKTMVKQLLKKGMAEANGMTDREGNKFDGYLSYVKNPSTNTFVWKVTKKS